MVSMAISIVVLLAFAYCLAAHPHRQGDPRDLRQPVASPRHPASTSTASCASSGSSARALAGLSGILWAYFRPGRQVGHGRQILLLMFAAVTLGGLGTAFGALVGSHRRRPPRRGVDALDPADLKYVGALVILIVVLLFRPQGILGRRERIG